MSQPPRGKVTIGDVQAGDFYGVLERLGAIKSATEQDEYESYGVTEFLWVRIVSGRMRATLIPQLPAESFLPSIIFGEYCHELGIEDPAAFFAELDKLMDERAAAALKRVATLKPAPALVQASAPDLSRPGGASAAAET